MRIGQLARRLGISPTEILGFLSGQNIEAESGANERLSEDLVKKVIGHFAPEKLAGMVEVAEATITVEPVDQIVEELPVEQPEAAVDETPEAPVEVIRVAKVELQGLKVVGKIDLPQAKKKEEPTEGEVTNTETEQVTTEQAPAPPRPRKEFQKRNDRREQREWKNPLEQKREQEARENESKRREQAEAMKEKRANHYYSKVKSVPTKPARKIEEQTVVEDIDVKEPPRTLFGKFFRWLRT